MLLHSFHVVSIGCGQMTSENITYILGGDEFMDSDASCQYQVVIFLWIANFCKAIFFFWISYTWSSQCFSFMCLDLPMFYRRVPRQTGVQCKYIYKTFNLKIRMRYICNKEFIFMLFSFIFFRRILLVLQFLELDTKSLTSPRRRNKKAVKW